MTDATSNPEDSPTNASKPEAGRGPHAIDKYFRAMRRHQASDLHLKADAPARLRIDGVLHNVDSHPLDAADIEAMILEITEERQIVKYRENGSIDFAYQPGKADRFRLNAFRQRGRMSVAARRIPHEIRSYEQLHLSPTLGELAKLREGLVLFAGTTASGKSTAIAAILEHINQTRACHIVTIEDPIEFVYEDKKAFVNQREIGLDVADHHHALKYLMREDPDVILIGELRDQETLSAALTAAETGHLVFSTIHAASASATIGRILELLPEESRSAVRSALVVTLQAVVCLKLLPGLQPDIPRVPCCEIMICNATVRRLIAEERDREIGAVLRNSYHEGMIDFTESLRCLSEQELISVKTGYAAAPNPDELKMRLKGISVTGGGIIG